MPRAHAKLPASGAHRWMNCPGSVKASELYPQTSSIYADEGTLAHSAAEETIETGAVSSSTLAKIKSFYEVYKELGGSVEEVQESIAGYVDYVKEEYADQLRQDPAAVLLTEQRVDFSKYVPGGFGTSDVVIIGDGQLHIVDLKYGKGVPVSAENNPQLRLYALGAIEALEAIYNINDVAMTIYQPRLDSVSTDIMSRKDLEAWGDEEVKPAAALALSKGAPFAAGDWCKFCPHRAKCKERAKVLEEIEAYREEISLDADDVAEILTKADQLTAFIDDIKEQALQDALNGVEIPGWKVVEGRSNRKFTGSEDDIVERAEAAGFDKALLYETKMITLTAIEKIMGKKAFAANMGDIVEKPIGKPTLAPESDKRPAYSTNAAIDDFADE